jgi:carotenoid cleavage dioxygenase
VEPVVSLQKACFVPRKNAKGEGDGYVMAVASNYESTTSDLGIADAQRMEDGVIATVKLPFWLRSRAHGNWFPQWVLSPIKDAFS